MKGMKIKCIINVLLSIFLFQVVSCAQPEKVKVTIEAASSDPTLVVRGDELEISKFSKNNLQAGDIFLVDVKDVVEEKVTAAFLNSNYKVLKVVEDVLLSEMNVAEAAFVVGVVNGENTQAKDFIVKKLTEGSVARLRINGELASLADILSIGLPRIKLDVEKHITVTDADFAIKGKVPYQSSGKKYSISFSDKSYELKDKEFSYEYKLNQGVNYIEIFLHEDDVQIDKQTLIVFLKKNDEEESKRLVLWVEQFPNAKELVNQEKVDLALQYAKEAGFNSVVLDIKGPEGYVSYRKNNLSKTPYFTATVNPKKKIEDTGFDLLQGIINAARKFDLRVYGSFNFFTEGNVTSQDYAVLKQHPEWEEVVQRPEDKGKLLRISESTAGQEAKAGKRIILGFVNPSNKEVVDFQLLRLREVLANYDLDGIVLDRTRYDNLYADFSDVSKRAFSEYLKAKGKSLENFPADAFLIDQEGKLVEGKHYIDWLTFRSNTIKEFAFKVREVVDEHNKKAEKKVEMAAYVGSWYEFYYQNGVNWASETFRYDNRLEFPESRIYTEEYAKTSYTDILDFLMIGTYYKTDKEIAKYVTLGNILTNNKVPIVASISLPDLADADRPAVFNSAVSTSAGLMIFDLCYIDWNVFMDQMKNIKTK